MDKVKVGSLWIRQSKGGIEFFSGEVNKEKVVAFKNTYKTEAKQPDYIVYKSEEQSVEKQTVNDPLSTPVETSELPW